MTTKPLTDFLQTDVRDLFNMSGRDVAQEPTNPRADTIATLANVETQSVAFLDVAGEGKLSEQTVDSQVAPIGVERIVADHAQPAKPPNGAAASTLDSLNRTRTLFSVKAWSSFVKDNQPQLLH